MRRKPAVDKLSLLKKENIAFRFSMKTINICVKICLRDGDEVQVLQCSVPKKVSKHQADKKCGEKKVERKALFADFITGNMLFIMYSNPNSQLQIFPPV